MSTEINAESPDGAADDTPKVRICFFAWVARYRDVWANKSIFMVSSCLTSFDYFDPQSSQWGTSIGQFGGPFFSYNFVYSIT